MHGGTTTFSLDLEQRPAVLAELRRLGFVAERPRRIARAIVDTSDGRLHRAGLRLEYVESAGERSRRLLLSGAGVVTTSIEIGDVPTSARDLPPGPFRTRVKHAAGGRTLRPLLEVSGREVIATASNAEGGPVAIATITDPDGDANALVSIVPLAGFGKRHRLACEAMTGLGLVGVPGDALDVAVRASATDLAGRSRTPLIVLDARMRAAEGFLVVLRDLDVAIDANWDGAVADSDPEPLHQLRVGIRRTRAVVAEASRVLPGSLIARARERFAWLGEVTGPARDLDVLIAAVRSATPHLDRSMDPGLSRLEGALVAVRGAAGRDLVEALCSDDAVGWRREWRTMLSDTDAPAVAPEAANEAADEPAPDQASRPLPRVIRKRIARAHDVLLRHGRAIDQNSAPEQLHDLRKDAKRLRYLIECFGALLATDERARFVSRLKRLQNNLGTYQDAAVQADQLRGMADTLAAEGDADAVAALASVAAVIDDRAAVARQRFGQRFAAYDSTATRDELDALLDGLAR